MRFAEIPNWTELELWCLRTDADHECGVVLAKWAIKLDTDVYCMLHLALRLIRIDQWQRKQEIKDASR